jgi:MarR family transcriptional regulator, transcriptional regulator for hemolysin
MISNTDPGLLDPGESASLGRLLALTSKANGLLFDARLVEAGGSLPTWIVLSQAISSPISPSQRELAERMGIGGATLVRHLDRLEADGLVTRRRDPEDRRITRVDITKAGRQRHQQLAVVADAADREMRALLSDEEERVLRDVLQRIGHHVRSAPRSMTNPPTDSTTGATGRAVARTARSHPDHHPDPMDHEETDVA